MADLCMCGHEEREHAYDPTESRPVCVGNAMACPCARYRRSPLSAFRGPAVSFTREEAAGWLWAMLSGVPSSAFLDGPGAALWHAYFDARNGHRISELRRRARSMLRHWREFERHEYPAHYAARLYLAARILRAVRP